MWTLVLSVVLLPAAEVGVCHPLSLTFWGYLASLEPARDQFKIRIIKDIVKFVRFMYCTFISRAFHLSNRITMFMPFHRSLKRLPSKQESSRQV